MRPIVGMLLSFVLTSPASSAERPWQTLRMPSAKRVAADFRTPPPEYGVTLWWGWDGPVDETVIRRDLDAIRSKKIRSVLIESGYGMSAPYLSPGWFELVALAVREARQREMRVWLADEGKYPSGFAGGKFSQERPDLRMQSLVVAERIELASGETLLRTLTPETVGAVAVNPTENLSELLDVSTGHLKWSAPGAQWHVLLVAHQFRTSVTRAVNNPTRGKDATNSLCDYLSPAATRQFLEWTHESYRRAFGAELGRTVMGFMGDEPDYAFTPWTPSILQEFQARKGYDVRPFLASFFAPRLTEEQRRARADYWDVWSALFGDNYFRVQADWCAAQGVEYLVHLNHEDKMMDLARSSGDYFRNMRHVQVPGIDTIWNQIWPGKISDFPKYASSAAHLYGRPRAFTESFAAYRTPPTVEQAKWVIDHQLARGINLVQLMFFPSSASEGNGTFTGWMGSDKFPAVVEYANRATYLLAQGRPTAQVALYAPTMSLWLGDAAADAATLKVMRQLLEHQRDFDLVDEQALTSTLRLTKGALRTLSGNEYRAVLVPAATAISRAALDQLRAFAGGGGRVIFFGGTPQLVVGTSFLKAEPPGDLSWARVEPEIDLTPALLATLPEADLVLEPRTAAVTYIHRRWRDADLYFLFNESEQPLALQATLSGSGTVRIWDAMSGGIQQIQATTTRPGFRSVNLTLEPYGTRFLVVGQ